MTREERRKVLRETSDSGLEQLSRAGKDWEERRGEKLRPACKIIIKKKKLSRDRWLRG